MPEANHPIWRVLSVLVVGVILILMLKYNYVSGWAPNDIITVITVLLGHSATEVVAKILGRRDV